MPVANSSSASPPLLAAQYLRMSTEHQQYSTENQNEAIERYAHAHGMQIVRTYSDFGRSGLNIAGREGLQQLLADAKDGTANCSVVLVYDVSRWGRFQDADESAYYEYVLKSLGIKVHYCAEQFENDGSLPSALLKTIKRTMAGEYSRELSVKVFAGQCRLVEMGFRQGGPAGYGLRRKLIDRDGNDKSVLARGERKSLQTDRVVLIPGPKDEIGIVEEIFERFVNRGENESHIADALNRRGVPSDLGRPWTRGSIHQILTNPKYVGMNIYNRRSFKLKRKRVKNPVEMWITKPGAFEPVIAAELFVKARTIIDARHVHLTDGELLVRLKQLLERFGHLSGFLIDEATDMPSSSAYASRFGGLHRAYELIGWTANRDFAYIEVNRRIRKQHPATTQQILQSLSSIGASVFQEEATGALTINGQYTATLVLARCLQTPAGNPRWHLRFDKGLLPDITIAARLAPDNESILDYYLFPAMDVIWRQLRVARDNGVVLDAYRFDNLNFFLELAKRTPVEKIS